MVTEVGLTNLIEVVTEVGFDCSLIEVVTEVGFDCNLIEVVTEVGLTVT